MPVTDDAVTSETGLAARLDRLEAYGQIRQLAWRYSAALDRRDIDTLIGLYDEHVSMPDGTSGREALRSAMVPSLERVRITILHVGNHVIDLDGPGEDGLARAHGAVYCHAEVQSDEDTWISQAIHYGDQYIQRGDRWYFASRRKHELFYGAVFGQSPIGLAPADWPVHDTGTGTVPGRWPSWQRFWGEEQAPIS
jgi:hypothetical protein